jgi:hypothetical protein
MSSLIHSFLLAVFPILYLYSANRGEVLFGDVLRSLLVSVVSTILILVILRVLLHNWAKSSLIWSGMLVLIFSYGHVYGFLKTRQIAGFLIGRHRLMLVLWVLMAAGWVWIVLKQSRKPVIASRYLNLIGLLLLVSPTYNIAKDYYYRILSERSSQANLHDANASSAELRADIYYIVLDGYGRSDVLDELYNYDNSDFLEFLRSRGFYVAENSRSNYNQTVLSLASSLNMEYVNYFTELFGADSKERYELAQEIKNNRIRYLLQAEGYQFVAFESGYERTEIRSADHYWSASTDAIPQVTAVWRFNAFEALLLESTVFRALFDLPLFSPETLRRVAINPEYQAHRDRVLYTLARLDDVAEMPGNYFVFAHILSPHPPFVFDQNGEALNPDNAYRLADGDFYIGTRGEYITGYRNQLRFISAQIESVIDQILAKSDQPPVIILQSDHGPGAYLVWESAEESNLKERLGILNAYYLPGDGKEWLYDSITPVNTFRVLMNAHFGGDVELLTDESYFSPWLRPYDFTRVTDMIDKN